MGVGPNHHSGPAAARTDREMAHSGRGAGNTENKKKGMETLKMILNCWDSFVPSPSMINRIGFEYLYQHISSSHHEGRDTLFYG